MLESGRQRELQSRGKSSELGSLFTVLVVQVLWCIGGGGLGFRVSKKKGSYVRELAIRSADAGKKEVPQRVSRRAASGPPRVVSGCGDAMRKSNSIMPMKEQVFVIEVIRASIIMGVTSSRVPLVSTLRNRC